MNCPKCGAPLVAGSGFCSGCGLQVATAAAVAPAKKSNKLVIGVVIAAVVCVMAVPVIGIIAAIAIPNLLSSIQRGKQKRTMGDMRTVSSSIEQYHTDFNHYPVAANMDELCQALSPDYMQNCIRKDGWWSQQDPREFAYAAWGGAPDGCKADADPSGCGPREYGLASAGKDAVWEAETFDEYDRQEMSTFCSDIVIRNGEFVRQPAGRQMNCQSPQSGSHPPIAPPEENLQPPSDP